MCNICQLHLNLTARHSLWHLVLLNVLVCHAEHAAAVRDFDFYVCVMSFTFVDQQTVDTLRKVTAELAVQAASVTDRSTLSPSLVSKLESLFFDQKPTQVWYYLEVAYALLMPAQASVTEDVWEFQV